MVRYLKKWALVNEAFEFEKFEVAPIWKNARKTSQFAMTIRWVGDFDGTGGETFRKRAMRKSGNILVRRFKTKEEYEAHPYLNGGGDYSTYVFIWDRDMNLVDGAF